MMRVVLPSVTTAASAKHSWRQALRDRTVLGISQIALFLTGLNAEERQELYACLEVEASIFPLRIPFVHARSDMTAKEYQYLIDKFGTSRFNLHPTRENPLKHRLPSHLKQMIYIENTGGLRERDLRGFAGICLDVSHLEDYKVKGDIDTFADVLGLVRTHGVGVSHVSAICEEPHRFKDGGISYALHKAGAWADLEYLKKYPKNFFGRFVAIELDNPMVEQLHIRSYIENNILNSARSRVRVLVPAQAAI